MIKAIIVFNNHGKPRVVKFYQPYSENIQQQIIKETFLLISKRDDDVCNFLECGSLVYDRWKLFLNRLVSGRDYTLIYRHYATLYFVFCVDSSESELGILDLIQVFVESLDKAFENVCELDLIFNSDKVYHMLNEIVLGGMVLETHIEEVITHYDEQLKIERKESGLSGAPSRAVSAVKDLNISQKLREIRPSLSGKLGF